MVKTVLASALLALVALTGCDFKSFDQACKDKGGVVETDRDSCVKTVNGKTRPGTRTERECLVDGREIDESKGSCT